MPTFRLILVFFLALTILGGGCSSGTKGSIQQGNTRTRDGESENSAESINVKVYFLKVEELVEVERKTKGADPVAASVQALLEGPTESERTEGISTAIPEGVKLLSYSFESGVVRLDFSGEMRKYGGGSARVLAIENQIKKTATANGKGIQGVEIYIEGVPSEESLQP